MGFIGKRLLITVITLLMVSLFTFSAFTVIPGDPATLTLGIDASEEQVAALRESLGLNRSFPERYFSWLRDFISGDLGNSNRFQGASISGMILERLPVTCTLALLSLTVMIIIVIPAVLFSVKREGSLVDRMMNVVTTMSISLPGFFLGILFIWFFGVLLKLFVPGGYVEWRENFFGFLGYLIFPALAIAAPNAAVLIKFLRNAVFKEFHSDYVRTAYSKGASQRRVLYRHVIKNALIPGITLLGMIVGQTFSGSIVIEQVFTIPGIGRLLIAAISSRDYLLVETLILYIALAVILANTLTDIAIQIIDPRLRQG